MTDKQLQDILSIVFMALIGALVKFFADRMSKRPARRKRVARAVERDVTARMKQNSPEESDDKIAIAMMALRMAELFQQDAQSSRSIVSRKEDELRALRAELETIRTRTSPESPAIARD